MVSKNCHGSSCSRSSYSREIGRIRLSATVRYILRRLTTCGSSSKSIMMVTLLDGGDCVEGRHCAGVSKPHFHGMLPDVAVAAEHLHGIVGHLEGARCDVIFRKIALPQRIHALVQPRCGFPYQQAGCVDL